MEEKIGTGWDPYLAAELGQPYMLALKAWLSAHRPFLPPEELVFNSFKQTPWDNVKVVILGQDPYHRPGQAMGLSFSVPPGVAIPPSLQNIFKEIEADLNVRGEPPNGDLTPWARQGVLLLNSILTVSPGEAGGHAKQGWEQFTDKAIQILASEKEQLVFLLWGNYAKEKASQIDKHGHLILQSAHPSPLSAHRGWFGNHHFSRCNQWLAEHDEEPIKWDYWNA